MSEISRVGDELAIVVLQRSLDEKQRLQTLVDNIQRLYDDSQTPVTSTFSKHHWLDGLNDLLTGKRKEWKPYGKG